MGQVIKVEKAEKNSPASFRGGGRGGGRGGFGGGRGGGGFGGGGRGGGGGDYGGGRGGGRGETDQITQVLLLQDFLQLTCTHRVS